MGDNSRQIKARTLRIKENLNVKDILNYEAAALLLTY